MDGPSKRKSNSSVRKLTLTQRLSAHNPINDKSIIICKLPASPASFRLRWSIATSPCSGHASMAVHVRWPWHVLPFTAAAAAAAMPTMSSANKPLPRQLWMRLASSCMQPFRSGLIGMLIIKCRLIIDQRKRMK